MVHDRYVCNECSRSLPVGCTVWYCDLCDFDICSCCMGYGEDPYGHAALARTLTGVCTAADTAYRAAQDAAALAPPSLLNSVPFREQSLHVSEEWLASAYPSMDVQVGGAHLTPTGSHVQRAIDCRRQYRSWSGKRLVPAYDDRRVVYTPAHEHESPAAQRRRTMRFRRREEQALFSMRKHFRETFELELESESEQYE